MPEPLRQSIDPQAEILKGVIPTAIRLRITPDQTAGFLTDIADMLRTVPEKDRVELMWRPMATFTQGDKPYHAKLRIVVASVYRRGLDDGQTFGLLVQLSNILDRLPEELRAEAIEPDSLQRIADSVKSKVR